MKFGDEMYMNERTLKEFNVYKFMVSVKNFKSLCTNSTTFGNFAISRTNLPPAGATE